jgi:peptide/nickel transport system substrate-binding protein
MVMEANPDYWGGKPAVDQLIYQQYANDDALVQALIAGDIDHIIVVPTTGVQALESDSNIAVSIGEEFYLEELIVNSSPEGTQPASLNDPVVRQAIAHAIDKQTIITVGYLGYATQANTVLPIAMGQFHNDQIVDPAYDIDEANRLLDEAGYVDSNGDGIREYSDGSLLEYRLYAPDSSAYYARIIEIIANDLALIGISAPPQVLSDDNLIALQVDYDNDLIYWGWYFDPDPGFALSVFTCAETEDGGWSDSGYCNEDYDALYQQQSVAVDEAERRDVIWQMQEILAEDMPYLPVAYPKAISAYRSDRFTFPPDIATLSVKWALFNGFSVVS